IGPVGRYALEQIEIGAGRAADRRSSAPRHSRVRSRPPPERPRRPEPPSAADRRACRAAWAGRAGSPPRAPPLPPPTSTTRRTASQLPETSTSGSATPRQPRRCSLSINDVQDVPVRVLEPGDLHVAGNVDVAVSLHVRHV